MKNWTRWFAWYSVELQNGCKVCWRWVEYEQRTVGHSTGAYGSGPEVITHYRLPDDAPEFRMLE